MNLGKFVFAQVMEHLPLHAFHRCVVRYSGEHKVKRFSCLDQYLCMAFAQLTYRESLRDIEACLRAQSSKLYHLGFRSRSRATRWPMPTQTRDWRIYGDFAQSLIGIARRLYADEAFGLDLKDTVYALDATTIDLCLSVFPWAPFRSTKAAVKLHTLLDLRGNIPSFILISDGKLHDVNILDQLVPEPGAIYVMDRGYIDFERLDRFHEAGSFFVIRAKTNLKAQRRYSHPVDREHRPRLRPDRHAHRLLLAQGLPRAAATHPVQGSRDRQDAGLPHQQLRAAGPHHHQALPLPLADRVVLQVDQAASADQGVLRHHRECREDADLDRSLGLRAGRHRQEAAPALRQPLRNPTDPEPHHVRANADRSATFAAADRRDRARFRQPIDFVRLTLGHYCYSYRFH